MANKIVLKKSSVAAKVPLSADLEVGEIAVNLTDQKLYSKKSDGTVILVGSGISGSGDVIGAASSTDNAITRFDGTTGKLIQNSLVRIDDDANMLGLNGLTFITNPSVAGATAGAMYWNNGDGTPNVVLNDQVELQLGQENVAKVYNGSGASIFKGAVVAVSGAQGQRPSIVLADADSEASSAPTLGIMAQNLVDGGEGFVCTFGLVRGIDTSGFTAGAPIYLSQTAGQFTQTRPSAPAHTVALGWVIKVNASSGEIFVNISNGWELDELHNVLITSPTSGNTLVYDATAGVWENANITAGTGISVTNGAGSITVNNTGVTSVSGTGTVNGLTLSGTVTTSGNLTLGGTLSGIANAALTNSSVTVNGTSIALGASGTVTANTTNALTFNNGGAGAASGTTFNGGAAQTISYNTIGAPSTTGTNASGTWGINITGNAATITSQANSATITASTTAGSANTIVRRDGNGYIFSNYFNATDNSIASGVTAIIAKQSDNYYRSATAAAVATFISGQAMNISGSASANLLLSGGTMTGLLATVTNTAGFTGANDTTLSIRGNPSYAAAMSFHRTGAYAVNLGLDTDNVFKLGGWSAGGVPHYWDMSGNAWATASMRSPLFYDNNNTGYYVDPAGTSNLNYAAFDRAAAGYDAGTSGSFSCSNWFRSSGVTGWFNASYGGGVYMTDSTFVSVYNSKGFYVANQVQGTIFYDANDTGWYCDPNNTSRFRILSVPSNVGSGTFPISVSSTDRGIIFGASSGSAIACYFTVSNGATISGNITNSGGSTSYVTSSDYRMKENVKPVDKNAALAKIMAVQPVTFNWLQEHGGNSDVGFIAHVLQEVAPECVHGEKDGLTSDGKMLPQGVERSMLVPTLCAAVQKQQELIEQLTAEVAALKGI